MYSDYEGKNLKGMVLRFEKCSIYDGDGLRTVVFLKGCPLRCQWCSTPESQNRKIETTRDGAITYGKVMTVEEVMVEVRKDSIFYFHSGGGMTLSGGEVLMQPEFTLAILKRARFEAIDSAIETTLFAPWETVEPVLNTLDTAMVDMKFYDPEKHKYYTGVSNERILENIRKAGTKNFDNKLIIRTPLIPGVNDSEEELMAIGRFLADLPYLDHLQLLPYHRYGTDTYHKLGRPYMLKDVEVPDEAHMEWCRDVVKRYYDHVI